MKQLLQILAVAAAGALLQAGPVGTLQVHVECLQTGTNFTYTLFNDEPAGSSMQLDVWQLTVNAPFAGIATPAGWDYLTDNTSYVDWFSTDSSEPYTNEVPPGGSLGGFAISSAVATAENLQYAVTFWKRGGTNNALAAMGVVASPSITSLVPALTGARMVSPEAFQCTVVGIPTLPYTLEVSTNLANWTALTTNTAPFSFSGANSASVGARYYRASYAGNPLVD